MLYLLQEIAIESVRTLYLAAPFLLLGLAMAGALHVLMPAETVRRWLGHPGLSGVTKAAAIGVPLPVCSCGVVPLAIEMRRKGASPPASVSFLTTTPESSADSILLTWGLMGPVMAIARPAAAFVTALIGGVAAIAYLPNLDVPAAAPACDHDHDHHDGHDHDHDHGLSGDPAAARRAIGATVRRLLRREARPDDAGMGVWRDVVRPALRYGFIEMLDDLAFWLVVGVLAAGVLGVLVPDDLASRGLGVGLMPMLLMLAVGIPIYMCASASTPVAAALMAKGISPGAALVFLLAGPATNAATIILLGRTFGRRFVQIYLVSVALGAILSGLALDALVGWLGWHIASPLSVAESAAFSALAFLSLLLLSGLLLWRLIRGGAWASGIGELRATLHAIPTGRLRRRFARRSTLVAALLLAAVVWLASGLKTVPSDSHGYAFSFGKLWRADLAPGLRWAPPPPIGAMKLWRTQYARKTDIGFRTDLELIAQRKTLARTADPEAWHSSVAAMNTDAEQATHLTADENLVEMSFTVHYRLTDPRAFFYGIDHQRDFVALYAEAAARSLVAASSLEALLTERRPEVERAIRQQLADDLTRIGAGIEVVSVHVVDVHPPAGAVFAFRDVSSASEEKETRIHQARETLAREAPRARGEAAKLVAEADAQATARRIVAAGEASAFEETAIAFGTNPTLLRHLLWLETAERVLPGRNKMIVPPGTADGRITLWGDAPRPTKGKKGARQ